MNARVAFERTLVVGRVADRFAMKFPSLKALKDYFSKHPDADRSKHKVEAPTESKKSKPKKEKKPKKDWEYEDEYGTKYYRPEKMPFKNVQHEVDTLM